MEAGRLLLETNRPVRAYASYLQTGFIRAHFRGFYRETKTFLKLIEQSFVDIKNLQSVERATGAWDEYIDSELRNQEKQNVKEEANLRPGNARDPVFAFAVVDRSSTIEQCRTEKGIEEAKLWFDLLKTPPQD